MDERKLSQGDVLEVLGPEGLTPKEFQVWCEKGIVEPIEGGGEQGKHRKFTVMQTVGIAVAVKIHKSEQGCVLPYAAIVIAAFSDMSEEQLTAQFEKGRTHFIVEHYGKPILGGNDYPDTDLRVDVQSTYKHVLKHIGKIEHRLRNFVGGRGLGRGRGLAGASER
jgi:hypothetical protein